MAKVYIRNPKQLEGFVTNKLANELFFSSNLQDISSEIMQEVTIKNVYDAYEPSNPNARRGVDGGFADMDNIEFTSVDVSSGVVRLVLENTTEGNDSMKGREMADTFEQGIKGNWVNPNASDNQGRVVSDARPFIEDTAKLMNDKKDLLLDGLKKDLRSLGFKVK